MLKRTFILVCFFYSAIIAFANSPLLSDSAKISLLTNMPSDNEVYSMYGHTGVRVLDAQQNIDVVFNYGIFDFNSPNFLYRFVKGETYYMVVPIQYSHYELEYELREVKVIEQVLNLTQTEKQKIWDALVLNSLPENRVYLYNFFYDNCSTRPRDIIEKNITGKVEYQEKYRQYEVDETFRDLVHQCVSAYPWLQFGIDLVIGAEADKKITDRETMFLPIYLKNSFSNATIVNETDSIKVNKKLVKSEHILLPGNQNLIVKKNPTNYPLIVGCIILTISIILHLVKKKFISSIFDFLLFAVAGLAGSVIFFLMFFSTHPTVDSNWNIVWLNPIMLIIAFLSCVKYCSKWVYYYHFINFVTLSVFLLAWFLIPQKLELAFLPYILSLCVRSGSNVIYYKSINKIKR